MSNQNEQDPVSNNDQVSSNTKEQIESQNEEEQIKDPVSEALGKFAVNWKNSMGEPEEGPMYVLWDLIESYRVDIFDVSLLKITEDFIHFLNTAGELQIELASSFTVMASKLLFYKSKALLPDPGFEELDEEPRLPPELVQQLLEYRKYQLVAEKLRERENIAMGVLPREKIIIPEQFTEESGWIDVSLVDLLSVYSRLLRRIEKENQVEDSYEVFTDEFSVEEKIIAIRSKLENNQSFSFLELFDSINQMKKNEFVATFLALLELTRVGEIILRQKINFSEIRIFKKSTLVS